MVTSAAGNQSRHDFSLLPPALAVVKPDFWVESTPCPIQLTEDVSVELNGLVVAVRRAWSRELR